MDRTSPQALLELRRIAPQLARDGDGIWRASGATDVSYPTEGNEICAQLEDESYWFRHRNACIVAMIRRFAPEGFVLDVGAGNGYVTRGLREAGIDAIALEPGPDGARNAAARGLAPVVCATLEGARLTTASVAAVGMFDVLEHIRDDRAALREVARVLKPGGYLYLTIPALEWLWSADDDRAGHFRRYTRRTLAQCLRDTGFRLSWISGLFWPFPLPLLFLRTIPSLLDRAPPDTLERYSESHALPAGVAGRVLGRALAGEARRVARGRPCPVGSSLLATARSAGR